MKHSVTRVLIAAYILSALSALAQTDNNAIPTAVPFLRITPDACMAGMGEAGTAMSDDANAIYWNSSRLAFVQHRAGISLSYVPWYRALVPDVNLYHVAAYFKPDSISAIGISGRYFSHGQVTYTSSTGSTIGQYKPYDYAIDASYSRKMNEHFAAGITLRFIASDLTNGITVNGADGRVGRSLAADLGFSWQGDERKLQDWTRQFQTGIAITNFGSKMNYVDTGSGEFIPTNLSVAEGLIMNKNNHQVKIAAQLDKLLVPTPPIYEIDSTTGAPKIVNGNYVIVSGKDPNVSVVKGAGQSFSDAPGGWKEELHEIIWTTGVEYSFRNIIKVRAGYFHEHKTKGNRQYLTLGAGVTFNQFSLDLAYLVPTNGQRSPLQNTLRFSLLFNIDHFQLSPHEH